MNHQHRSCDAISKVDRHHRSPTSISKTDDQQRSSTSSINMNRQHRSSTSIIHIDYRTRQTQSIINIDPQHQSSCHKRKLSFPISTRILTKNTSRHSQNPSKLVTHTKRPRILIKPPKNITGRGPNLPNRCETKQSRQK